MKGEAWRAAYSASGHTRHQTIAAGQPSSGLKNKEPELPNNQSYLIQTPAVKSRRQTAAHRSQIILEASVNQND